MESKKKGKGRGRRGCFIPVALCLLLSGCVASVEPKPELEVVVKQHSEILSAIAAYVADLQEKGVLPFPEKKVEK